MLARVMGEAASAMVSGMLYCFPLRQNPALITSGRYRSAFHLLLPLAHTLLLLLLTLLVDLVPDLALLVGQLQSRSAISARYFCISAGALHGTRR